MYFFWWPPLRHLLRTRCLVERHFPSLARPAADAEFPPPTVAYRELAVSHTIGYIRNC
jgi:hypothetical protein